MSIEEEVKIILDKYSIDKEYLIFPVLPISAPRMTRADKWKKRKVVTSYFAYKNSLRLLANQYQYTLTSSLSLIFCLPIPDSYSKKKKKELLHQGVTVKPDLDNLIKGYKDALCENDSFVYRYELMMKVYSVNPMIIVLQ
jgi:Holliday junction resolvase RusA-like endonuclease